MAPHGCALPTLPGVPALHQGRQWAPRHPGPHPSLKVCWLCLEAEGPGGAGMPLHRALSESTSGLGCPPPWGHPSDSRGNGVPVQGEDLPHSRCDDL